MSSAHVVPIRPTRKRLQKENREPMILALLHSPNTCFYCRRVYIYFFFFFICVYHVGSYCRPVHMADVLFDVYRRAVNSHFAS